MLYLKSLSTAAVSKSTALAVNLLSLLLPCGYHYHFSCRTNMYSFFTGKKTRSGAQEMAIQMTVTSEYLYVFFLLWHWTKVMKYLATKFGP